MKKIVLILILIVPVILIFSCKKRGETKAIITVVTENDKPVAGATIELHARDIDPPGVIEETKTSDSQGRADFVFKNEAIYTVEAVKDTLYGIGTVRLEPHKTVEATVIMRPVGP
jgi:hypothetical protein